MTRYKKILKDYNCDVFGRGLKPSRDSQKLFGAYNDPNTDIDAVLVIGVGTSDTDRKNGLAIYTDGISIGDVRITTAQLKKLLSLIE